jgi:hypothetical protein
MEFIFAEVVKARCAAQPGQLELEVRFPVARKTSLNDPSSGFISRTGKRPSASE